MKPNRRNLLFFLFAVIVLSSCKKDKSIPVEPEPELKISTAEYEWGELSINRKQQVDTVSYDVNGNIKSVKNYDDRTGTSTEVLFTYSGNTLTLNTSYKDKYEFDEAGRVVSHSFNEIQQGHDIISTQLYYYDANGYLSKITDALTFDGMVNPPIITITYEVKNGNYTKYTVTSTEDTLSSREYVFKYNTGRNIHNPGALFVPVFSNNTYISIDKYLNYGKASVNALSSVDYVIVNADISVMAGTLNAVSETDPDNYLVSLKLNGSEITGFPFDNLSPLARYIKFSYIKK